MILLYHGSFFLIVDLDLHLLIPEVIAKIFKCTAEITMPIENTN